MSDEVLIHTQDLSVGHRSPLLSDINMHLLKGELVGLIGMNGTGKSTLLNTLAGLLPPLKGTVHLLGKELRSIPAKQRARSLAVVPSSRPSVGQMDVRMLIALGRQPWTNRFGAQKPIDNEKAQEAIELAGISGLVQRNVGELSDGERQKVMIARALAQDTQVLLLDEPTAFLDVKNRVMVMDMLHRIGHETGRGVLLSSHDLQLTLDLCDRIAVITSERSLWMGTPQAAIDGEVMEQFEDERVMFDRTTGSFKLK